MAATNDRVLVASQLSSLFAATQPIPVPTTRRDVSDALGRTPANCPPEHATHVALSHALDTGPVLLRLTHGHRVLEVVCLHSDNPPLRFDFPSPILPYPAITHEFGCVYIVAVTASASLYHIALPVRNHNPSWQPQDINLWCREYEIQTMPRDIEALVHVHDVHCIVIALPDGSLLRVESDLIGRIASNDEWTETRHILHRTLPGFSFLLAGKGTSGPEGNQIVAVTSIPPPTDVGQVWTLSRDRVLRVWTATNGSAHQTTLPAVPPGKFVTPDSGSTQASTKPSILLPPDPQRLIRAFPEPNANTQGVLVFIPTESSATSGGFFHLYRSAGTALLPIATFEAPKVTGHSHLTDFVVDGTALYTLWDKEGQSMVQEIELIFDESSMAEQQWHTANYHPEAELTPAYLDELLLAPGSLTDKFFEAIMRPGMFSPLTLQIAIDQYADACRSLPGPAPPQLLTAYTNVAEQIAAVVGCTVKLTRDPHTGAPQHTKYWNALKRDWEGFIARCREVERSARWPLALGLAGAKDGLLVIERERVAALVPGDFALQLHRDLEGDSEINSQYELLDLIWKLREKLGPRTMRKLEDQLVMMLQQELSFSFADVVSDSAARMHYRDYVDEGLESWVTMRLSAIRDVEAGIRAVMDIIGGYDQTIVKPEQTEVELTDPKHPGSAISAWRRALIASYATASIQARYELALSLAGLLYYLADELHHWDPALVGEILVVFRGAAMSRYVTRQPAGDIVAPSLLADGAANDDDVVLRMRNMHVSARRYGFKPTYSLVHRLLAQDNSPIYELPGAAHAFVDNTGLLQSIIPSHATKLEVQTCENLRLLGYHEVAREMLAWLPRTPGVTYVQGRLWLEEGRLDDAATVMESLAGSFGPKSALSDEDKEALAAVLPGAELFESEFDYYLHTAGLFKTASDTLHEVSFTQLAIPVAPPGADTASLWHGAIRGLTDLGLYEDAYASLISTPYEKLKRECISQLIYRMCEEDAVKRLMSFNFAGLADEVEDALAFKARNADPRIRPFYSRILYAWYITRGDYRSAALTMYQRARKLGALIGDVSDFVSITELQLEAYVVGMNALALTDQKNTWIVLPVTGEAEHEPRKRRKLSRHIPESRYSVGKRDAEIVHLFDMQYEYTLLSARLELIRRDPTLLSAGGLTLSPPSIIMRLAQTNLFSLAMATARCLKEDMTDLFGHLTRQCLRLSRNPDAVLAEDSSDWLLTDKVSSWPGTPIDRGWRYLRQALERHDGPDTDFKYNKVTLETILEYDRASPPPPWLVHTLEIEHPEYLIRTCLRYDNLESALDHVLALMRRSDARLAQEQPKTSAATWLPYTLIDQVLLAADSQEDLSSRGKGLQKELRTEITNRIKRVQKYSQASS
ncbi:hypothetical protein DAEQUDRAFT_195531 [Daedalea quercina L-15889]|uniref:Uncharacterized protein n=1 Tax=Daedalea quercina L-15889 TaxID=1314783 RepID=A0A165U7A7_9APHY|nr:hypothetical protein DAEQUDRAFT_195531 [Daedalea quercina L-15889]